MTKNIKVHALKAIKIISSIRCELSRCMDVLSWMWPSVSTGDNIQGPGEVRTLSNEIKLPVNIQECAILYKIQSEKKSFCVYSIQGRTDR